MAEWYDEKEVLSEIALDYRIKSKESILNKYNRYYPNAQVRKTFNDTLGFRAFCDNYKEVLSLNVQSIRIADMSNGKANDDGYRGVHLYFQLDNSHYPIEVQFNTLYDRQMNNWLHEYVYKKNFPNSVGQKLRHKYESGSIKTEDEFLEVLQSVLLDC